jgi:hypothetical protein
MDCAKPFDCGDPPHKSKNLSFVPSSIPSGRRAKVHSAAIKQYIMKTITSIIASCSMAVALLGVSSLQAAVVLPGTLDIDFRDASWVGATNNQTFTVGGITANAFATSVLGGPLNAVLGQTVVDGAGVNRTGGLFPGLDDPNEVEVNERLEIQFAGGSGLSLAGVWLTNLFLDDSVLPGNQTETALLQLTLLDSTIVNFVVPGSETNGNFFLDFGANRNVSKIDFRSSGAISDYSVAGFSVPEGGSTLAVLGMTLVCLAGVTSYQRRLAV